MLILTAYKNVLQNTAAVNSKVQGGYHIGRVEQGAKRPNVLLQVPPNGTGQDYSHSGPVGLFDSHVKITARADTAKAAFELGEAIARALQEWTGALYGCSVQMTEHFASGSDYDSETKTFLQIEEFTSFYTRTS